MSSININTNQTGTYNISYKATDEASNITNNNRNIYILPNVVDPSIVLKASGINMSRELVSAMKPGSTFQFEDRGYIAYDSYGNSSEDFPMIKQKVTTEHRRHADKDDDDGILIYSETNGVVTIPNVTDSGKISTNTKPQYLYLFKLGNQLLFYNNNWEPSDDDYQTSYFTIKYILSIPGYNSVSVTRKVYITDIAPPMITLATVSNPEQVEAGSNFTDNATFNTLENYWYFDNETIPQGYTNGFTMPDGNNDPSGSIIIRDPNNQTVTAVDTSILGIWKIYYTFYCTYSATNINGQVINNANFVPYTLPIGDATGDPISKSYTVVRNVDVKDTTPPIVELKKIGNGESSPLTFGSNNSGKLYTLDDNVNGSNYNMYFWIPLNSTDKPSLQTILPNIHVIGEFGSSNIPNGNAEIVIRDNAGSQQNFTVNVSIFTPPNISIPGGTSTPQILRSSIGTDFNDAYDYNYFPIAGTVSNPAIYTIVYTVNDQSNNTTTISRRLYIIDRSIPDIVFNSFTSPVSYSTIGNGLIYNKKSKTIGQPNNTVLVFANNSFATTYSDEFGDIVIKNISHKNPQEFINGYRKDRPQNVFIISYNSSNSKYKLKTFYNKDIDESPLKLSVKEKLTGLANDIRSIYTKYYFDISDTSLANKPPIRFVPSGGWGTNVSNPYIGPSNYTPQGTYHSFFSCDFEDANTDENITDGFVYLEEYVNGSWRPSSSGLEADLEIILYNPYTDDDDVINGGWNIR